MRKFLMTLAAFVCCAMTTTVFTACTNGVDDNSVYPQTGSAVITVNPTSLYDELDLTEIIRSREAEGKVFIADTVLIYNEKGDLVSKLGTEVNTLQPFQLQTDDLPNGTYTILVWQALRGAITGTRAWVANNEEQLSTVNITTIYGSMVHEWAVGMASTTITIDGNVAKANVAPKSMGSVVEVQLDGNTEDKGYNDLRLYNYQERVYGFYLNPACTDENRWMVSNSYNIGGVVAHLMPGNSSGKFFTLNCGDDMNLTLWKTYTDKSILVASNEHAKLHAGEQKVYYLNLDRIDYQPPFFGTADAFTAWKSDRDDDILVFDPYLKWGGNFDELQQHIQSRSWWYDCGQKEKENGYWQYYAVANKLYENYFFETANGESLRWVYATCYDPNVTVEAAKASLVKQGYKYRGRIKFPYLEDVRDLYFSEDGATEVQIVVYDDGVWQYFYQPTDPDDFQYIIEE